jgi:uncharacterized protein YoxC
MFSTRLSTFSASVDDIKHQLHAIQVETSNLVEQQKDQAKHQELLLDTIADTQQEELATFKANLLDQISLAMNTFANSQSDKLRTSHQNVKQSIQSSMKHTNTYSHTVHNISNDLNSKVETLNSHEEDLVSSAVGAVDSIHKVLIKYLFGQVNEVLDT